MIVIENIFPFIDLGRTKGTDPGLFFQFLPPYGFDFF